MGRYLLLILILAPLWLLVASFRHSVVQLPVPKGEVAYGASYEFADPCGLEAVVCPDEIQEPTTEQIISIIAQLETQNGKTGVGKSRNNLTGLRDSTGYLSFPDQRTSIEYSVDLWNRAYGGLDVESALAKWKTGNKNNRDPQTLKYIANFKLILEQN